MQPQRSDAQNNGECTLPDTMKLLELLGWTFELDEDDQLVITTSSLHVSVARINDILQQCRKRVIQEVKFKAARERRQFLGGPLNGQMHTVNGWCSPGIARNLSRGRWVAYRLEHDGRAFYLGEATNKKKANQLIYKSLPKNSVHRAPEPIEPKEEGWKDSYGDDDDD